ncbi:MAG: alpha/beta hydrolase [Marmoricola sp.]|jgi:pimeloyl-ACP methyl ester carboxylesterase|nr:alpha/beta hydrolase [Marmoricola sp.]
MSAPLPQQQPRRGASTLTIVVAVGLVLVLGLTGAGLIGWATWSHFRNDNGGSVRLADPPPPSTTAQAPSYPPQLARYYGQHLDWNSCGANQCSRLKVPLDYAKPDGATIELAVLRAPATRRTQRVGQLVVNPGGPGGSGVDYASSGSSAFGEVLTRYFDIVGFDPRGVGKSTSLKCADTAQLDQFLSADPDPDNAAETSRLDRLTRQFGQGCLRRSGDLTRHVSTVEAAKDMDILRAALGEPRLDYLGASYGTFLGTTYADLFPTHVRRMVLDGAVDPALSSEQLSLGQARGFETALRAYLQDCVDKGACVLGDSVDAGARRISQFLDQVDAQPLPTSSGRKLTEGLAQYGIIAPLYVKSYWPLLTSALERALRGNGDQLLMLSDSYTMRGFDRYTSNSTEILYAVNCLDHDDYVPISQVPSRFAEFDKASPTFGRIFAYGLSTCASWPVRSGHRTTALAARGAPPIVVVGTTRDPATPYQQSVSLARELQSGVLVSRDGDGHTGFMQGNRCVDGAIESYLVGGKVPKDGLSC